MEPRLEEGRDLGCSPSRPRSIEVEQVGHHRALSLDVAQLGVGRRRRAAGGREQPGAGGARRRSAVGGAESRRRRRGTARRRRSAAPARRRARPSRPRPQAPSRRLPRCQSAASGASVDRARRPARRARPACGASQRAASPRLSTSRPAGPEAGDRVEPEQHVPDVVAGLQPGERCARLQLDRRARRRRSRPARRAGAGSPRARCTSGLSSSAWRRPNMAPSSRVISA